MYPDEGKGGSALVKGGASCRAFRGSIELTGNRRQSDVRLRRAIWNLRRGDVAEVGYNYIV